MPLPPTPNMGLLLPSPSMTIGPQWASMVNNALATVDTHNHSPGKGALVPSSGIGINAPLNFNSQTALGLNETKYISQAIQTGDLNALYALGAGGDLYWNDSSGHQVGIVVNGVLNASSIGGISGLGAPPGTATAGYGSSTFTWLSAPGAAAQMANGPITIYDTAVAPGTGNGITIESPPSLNSAYTLRLPTALPGSLKFLIESSAGFIGYGDADNSTLANTAGTLSVKTGGIGTAQLAAQAVTAAKIANNTITRAQEAAVGQQVSVTSSTFSTSSSTFQSDPNMHVTLTSTGRPIIVTAISSMIAGGGSFGVSVTQTSGFVRLSADIQIIVSGSANTTIGWVTLANTIPTGSAGTAVMTWPPSTLFTIYTPPAGTYTFTVQTKTGTFAGSMVANNNMFLIAYEL